MMLRLVILFVCLHVVFTQTAPQISETFNAAVRITIKDGFGEHVGYGAWGIDQPGNMGVENYKFDHNQYDVFILQRYDLGKQYFLESTNTSHCKSMAVNGTMPALWAWLQMAKFLGKAGHGSESVDVWEARVGYAVMRIALRSNTSIPVYLIRESRDERKTSYEFLTWNSTAPSAKYFTVPSECSTVQVPEAKPARSCIAGSEIMARAAVWVKEHVPYNQGGTYQGYREDCSGYVSMCWDSSKPGHTTYTMHEIAKPISKHELKPGDCLLYAAEHVVLFGGWTDSSQTYYMGYEETKPGTGTIAEKTPYPYWYSQGDFLPYRYDNIC